MIRAGGDGTLAPVPNDGQQDGQEDRQEDGQEDVPSVPSSSAAAAPQRVVQPLNWEAAVSLVNHGLRLRRRRWWLHLGAAAVLGVAGGVGFFFVPAASLLTALLTALLVALSSTLLALLLLTPARLVISLIDRAMLASLCREEGVRIDVVAAAVRLAATSTPAGALVQAIKVNGSLRESD